jgi:hypothetical protein
MSTGGARSRNINSAIVEPREMNDRGTPIQPTIRPSTLAVRSL